MKALVVDDSRSMRMIVKKSLVTLNFEVEEAGNGKEALAKIKDQKPFDVIFLDWNMPEMNGLDFVKLFRTDANNVDVKIMMITTEAEMTQLGLALEAGVNEYLMKPFTNDMLVDKLNLLGLYFARP